MVAMQAAHTAVNLKLHHAVASTQQDFATFIQDTSQQLSDCTIMADNPLGGLAVVAGILLAIVSCIFCRCVAARRAASADGDNMMMA
jgi:hypothetical protein